MTKNSLKIFIATSMLISSTVLATDLPVGIGQEAVNQWEEENAPTIDVDNSGDTTSVVTNNGEAIVTRDYNTDGTLNSESVSISRENAGISRSESYQSDSGGVSSNVKREGYSRSSSETVQDGTISSSGTVDVGGEVYDATSSITKNGNQELDIEVDYDGQEKDGWIKSTTNSNGSETIETSGGRSRTVQRPSGK